MGASLFRIVLCGFAPWNSVSSVVVFVLFRPDEFQSVKLFHPAQTLLLKIIDGVQQSLWSVAH
jgi:hypothetical protein